MKKYARARGCEGSRYPFLTLKERDLETGLDYFGARYYSSTQGRFTSADPLLSSGKSLQPQSWNRYSYCLNEPLKYVDPKGLIWGYQNFEEGGKKLRRYVWFEGKKVGKGYTAFTPDKNGSIIALKDGNYARLYRQGTYDLIAGAPKITSSGQENLNAAAGAFDGAIPFGRHIREWAFGGPGGVDSESPEYQNASTISAGVQVGAGLMSGAAELKAAGAAAEETTTLFRAVSNAEFEQIMRTGTFEAGPNSLAGKWFAETAEHAEQWGQVLEGKGAFKIVDARIPTVQAEKFMRLESLDGIGPARYAELHQLKNAVIGKGP